MKPATGIVANTTMRVRTEHVCISSKTRKRQPLPPPLAAWVKGAGA